MEDIWDTQCRKCRYSWARLSMGEPEETGCDIETEMSGEELNLADGGECPRFEPW